MSLLSDLTSTISGFLSGTVGIGAQTSSDIAGGLVNAGIGAGASALLGGSPLTGALIGGGLGLTGNGLGQPGGLVSDLLSGQATGAYPAGLGSASLAPTAPGSATGLGSLDTGGGAAFAPTAPGSATGLGSLDPGTTPSIAAGSTGGVNQATRNLGMLSALAQAVSRPSQGQLASQSYAAAHQGPAGALFNSPLQSTGYINRQQVPNYNPSTGNWYTYGNQPEPLFYSGNDLSFPSSGFARGGALTMGRGAPFSTGGGEHHVRGEGGGQDDRVNAKLSNDEWVVDANFLSALGDGSSEEGSRRLYAMRRKVMQDKGIKHTVPPKLKKSPLQYLAEVSR